MHHPKLLTLACALAFALSGCNQPQNVKAPAKSSASQPAVTTLTGPIDAGKALAFLYGNYDAKANAARVDGDRIVPILAEAAKESEVERFFLVTSSTPNSPDEASECEWCIHSIDMAVFVRNGAHWALEGHTPALLETAPNGDSPGAKLIATGPQHHDVRIDSSTFNRGTTERSTSFVGLVTGKPTQLFRITTSFDDRETNCWVNKSEEKNGMLDHPCSVYEIDLAWRPGPRPDRYDIHATASGSSFEPGAEDNKAFKLDGTAIFRFDGKTYSAISKPSHWPIFD
jgi:hypothetical protein